MRLSRKWHLRLQQVNCNDCQGELKSHLETLPARRRGLRPGIPQISCSRLRAKDCCYCYPKTPPVALLQLGEVVGGTCYFYSLTERHAASYSGEFHVSSCLHVKLHRTVWNSAKNLRIPSQLGTVSPTVPREVNFFLII